MISMGKRNTVTVIRKQNFGVYIDGAEMGEILIPNNSGGDQLDVGDEVGAFLYFDSDDRPIGTLQQPKAEVGDFAFLEVTDANQFGAFLDWGLEKDLFVPFSEQPTKLNAGQWVIVYVYRNRADGRITATTRIDRHLDQEQPLFHTGQVIDILVAMKSDLGHKVIVNNQFWGLVHNSDITETIEKGESRQAYIKRVRPDDKIDVILTSGKQKRSEDAEKVMSVLNANDGFAPFNDKSDPASIQRVFGMSKGAFKKVIGGLYKAREIEISPKGIKKL